MSRPTRGKKMEMGMTAFDKSYIVDRIAADLDAWISHRDYFATVNGGSPDRKQVAICEAKIAELNADLEKYSF